MKQLVFTTLTILLFFGIAVGQQSLEKEIDRIATSLLSQMRNDKVKMAAVIDFTYKNQNNTRLGKYLADELSVALTRKGASMMSRAAVQKSLAEAQLPREELLKTEPVDPSAPDSVQLAQTLLNTGAGVINLLFTSGKALKGVEAVVGGYIEDNGDYLRIVIEVTKNNSKGIALASESGNFVKTPQIREMANGVLPATQMPPPVYTPTTESTPSTIPVYPPAASITERHNHLIFEVIGCRQTGREVECKFNIISENLDDQLSTYLGDSKITDASNGHEFHLAEMKLADASGTFWYISKSLIGDIPIEATFKFKEVNQKIGMIARLDLKCSSNRLGNFFMTFRKIPVQ